MVKNKLYSVLLCVLLSGCTSQVPAPVVSMSSNHTNHTQASTLEAKPVDGPVGFNVQVEKVESESPVGKSGFTPEPSQQSFSVESSSAPTQNAQKQLDAPFPTNSKSSVLPVASALQWQWPCDGRVTRFFKQEGIEGIEIMAKEGMPVRAAANGEVVYRGNSLPDYGNMLIIKHNDEFLSAYAHNQTLLVQEKDQVKAGQVIAEIGRNSTNQPVLHFEIRHQGEAVDPMRYLPK